MLRIKIINHIIQLFFFLLALGIFNLGVVQGKRYQDFSNKNCLRLLKQKGSRGNILDSQGNVIADSRLSYNVLLSFKNSKVESGALGKMSKILALTTGELKEKFRKGFVSPSLPVLISKNTQLSKVIPLEELRVEFPGLMVEPEPLRNYPSGKLCSNVLGYVNEIDRWRLTKLADYGYKTKDIVGFGGIEEKYDYYLRQEEGGLSIIVDHRGRFVRVFGFRPASNGKDIQLTINLKAQQIAEEALADKKGSIILMDPNDGAIIAMASAPTFNPAVFVDKANAQITKLFKDKDSPLINRAISGEYPAGSIFKLIVATAALETKKINPASTFFCQGSLRIGKGEFDCWSTHNEENLIQAIEHSCNVYFYRTGILTGAQAINDYATRFGFSKTSSIELPYEAAGFIPSSLWRKLNKFKNWYDGDTANLSIGQGEVLVTPLQVTRMMAVFANKGKLVSPHIVKSIAGRDVTREHSKISSLGLRDNTINTIRLGLRNVVSQPEGTAYVLSTLPVAVAGKTGTAQAPPGQAHAWFAGFFPFNNPKYVLVVFLEHAGPGYYSCLVAKQIIERMSGEGLI